MNELHCLNCKYFDPDDTALPVCMLHRKYMHDQWSCGDFSSLRKEGSDAGKKDA